MPAQVSSGGNACPGPPKIAPTSGRTSSGVSPHRSPQVSGPAAPSGYPAGMARARVGFGGALARLGFLVVLSAVCGALVAAVALPAVGGAGIATRNAIGTLTFSELPPELRTPPLSQRSVIKAADGTTLATFYYENRQSVDLSEVSPIMR